MMFPPNNSPAKFVVLEADGKLLSTHEAKSATGMPALWPCDIDGDGIDEAAFLSGEFVCVARADQMHSPLWIRRVGHGFSSCGGVFDSGSCGSA